METLPRGKTSENSGSSRALWSHAVQPGLWIEAKSVSDSISTLHNWTWCSAHPGVVHLPIVAIPRSYSAARTLICLRVCCWPFEILSCAPDPPPRNASWVGQCSILHTGEWINFASRFVCPRVQHMVPSSGFALQCCKTYLMSNQLERRSNLSQISL